MAGRISSVHDELLIILKPFKLLLTQSLKHFKNFHKLEVHIEVTRE